MDKIIWIIIGAAVAIGFAGVTLFVGIDGLQGLMNDTDDTRSQACSFEISECESGNIDFDSMSPQCQDEFENEHGETTCPP